MAKTISATALRQNLAQLLDELAAGQTHFVVERNNQPAAVLMSVQKFSEIRRMIEFIAMQEYITDEAAPRPPQLPEGVTLPPPAAALAERARAYYDSHETDATDAANIRQIAARIGLRVVR